jgi:predicted nuclease with RNAse H fold
MLEVHPASTHKALESPPKNWDNIQALFLQMGLKDDLKSIVAKHEIDAVTAALTGYIYLQGKTQLIGNEREGYIAVQIEHNWRKMQL